MRVILYFFLILVFTDLNGQTVESLSDQQLQYGFIENNGQIVDQANQPNPSVKYLLPLPNNTVLLKSNGFSYDTYSIEEVDESKEGTGIEKSRYRNIKRKYHRVDVEFVGANPTPQIFTGGEASDYLNYVSNAGAPIQARHFKKVTYVNLYPGIDLEFLAAVSEDKPVEYNFIVRPGADIDQIQLRYKGANSSRLKDGKIELDLTHGKLTESIPASYWKETKRSEKIKYKKIGGNKEQITIGFEGSFDKSRKETLIIDPTPNLEWVKSFLGWTVLLDLFLDENDNVYTVGQTVLTTLATAGTYQPISNGGNSGLILKFDSNGLKIWGTYYGDGTMVTGITGDAFGNVYVTGYTSATSGIATIGTHQLNLGQGSDVFVAKFNSSGNLVWGSYYDSQASEHGMQIAVDNSQQIYTTYQVDNQSTLLKWNDQGRIEWQKQIGEIIEDIPENGSVVIDPDQNILVNYWDDSQSSSIIRKYNANGDLLSQFMFDNMYTNIVCDDNGNIYGIKWDDYYTIIKISSTGVFQWDWDTQILDWGPGSATNLTVGSDGRVYVTGMSASTQGYPTEGALEEEFPSGGLQRRPFIALLNTAGDIDWWTYYTPPHIYDPGIPILGGNKIAVDSNNNIYLCGDSWIMNGFIAKLYIPQPCPFSDSLEIQNTQYLCAQKFTVPVVQECQASYLWDFGDGSTSEEVSPMHVYANSGMYTVTLDIVYNCGTCEGDTTLTLSVNHNPAQAAFEEQVVEIQTESKVEVLNATVATFSDAWSLPHYLQDLHAQNPYRNGSQGVWRNNSSYAYQTPRAASASIDISKDGTYTMEMFDWERAALNAVPKWIKATSMTQYSPFSYELENKDVLDNYTAALYDYGGHLPSANGVNMRNNEMAFTSFEYLDNKITGNLLIGNLDIPQFTSYDVESGNSHIAVVKASLDELSDVTEVDVILTGYKLTTGATVIRSSYSYQNEILCKIEHPETSEWSIIVLRENPYDGLWQGQIRIANPISPVVAPVIDTLVAHTGKSSLEVTQPISFDQPLISLEAGKTYYLNAWVSVINPTIEIPTLANDLGIVVTLKDKENNDVLIQNFEPTGVVIEGWQQVRGSFICPAEKLILSLTFKPGSTGTAWYDDLRIHPENGNMQSYVYNLYDYRLQAVLDAENFATFFYYDVEGNLYLTKKETAEGIKTLSENISYQIEQN